MAERNYAIGRGGKRIKIDTEASEKKKEELRQLELEKYEVKIPAPSGSGQMNTQIELMAQVMKDLYDEVQALIQASEKMVEQITKTFKETDEGGLGGIGGEGSMGGRL